MQNNKFLGTEKVSKLLLRFSVPCIISLLISALYNIVDQIFIGNSELGYLGNAATSIVFPITIVSFAFAWCFGDGTAALMSIRQGRKQTKGLGQVVGNCVTAVVLAGILFIALGWLFMDPLLYAFGASEGTIDLARSYFTIILFASIAPMLAGAISGVIRADGRPAYAMATTAVGAILNIILDPIFIFGFGWGIEGAAWATAISQIVSVAIGVFYLVRMPKTFRLKAADLIPRAKVVWSFTKLGISTFITQMSIVVTSFVCNAMLAKYGALSVYGPDIPIAVIGIAMKVFTIVINIVVGLVVGAQPILGYNYGAGNYDRIRQTFRIVCVTTLIVGIVATLIFQFAPGLVINIFGASEGLYDEFAQMTFRTFLMLIIATNLVKMSSIFFQAIGAPVKAAVISLIRDIVCFVPLCLILPAIGGVTLLLWAAPIADAIGVIVAGVLVWQFFWTLRKTGEAAEFDGKIVDSKPGVIITIARRHGSAGKAIGQLVAKELGIPFYYKEMVAVAAKESGLSQKYISDINSRDKSKLVHDLYLGSAPANYAIEAQRKAIREIAKHGSCVIIGRAADHVLRTNKNVVRVFITAPEKYRVKKLQEMYGDTPAQAKKSLIKSDKNRASYYRAVSGKKWGEMENYDLVVDSSIGNEKTAAVIAAYARAAS